MVQKEKMMKPEQFFRTYGFHDSGMDRIVYDPDGRELMMEVDLCAYEQPGYVKGSPEIVPVWLRFTGVEAYENERPDSDSNQILQVSADGSRIKFCNLTDVENDFYLILIKAREVEMLEREEADS